MECCPDPTYGPDDPELEPAEREMLAAGVVAGYVCKHCPGVWREMDEADDADLYDDDPQPDPGCPKCGSDDYEYVDCHDCGGDGEFDEHDDDPINYAPGESYAPCATCHGKGGWIECYGCQRVAREAAEKRIAEQTLPLFGEGA